MKPHFANDAARIAALKKTRRLVTLLLVILLAVLATCLYKFFT